MYAIIESGGKQYKAIPEGTIEVDRLDVEVGTQIDVDKVLFVANESDYLVGTPYVEGAQVKATVVDHYKGRKIIVFKYKSRVNYRRKKGHRQHYTRIKIDSITV